MLIAQKSTKLSKQQEFDVCQPRRSKHSGTGLLLSSHSESFIAALYDILDRAYSMFAKGSEQWGSVTVRTLTANRTNIPICDSEKSPLRWRSDSKNNPAPRFYIQEKKNLSRLSVAKSEDCNPVYPLDKKQSAPTLWPLYWYVWISISSLSSVSPLWLTCHCLCCFWDVRVFMFILKLLSTPPRSSVSIMLETWLLFRQALSVEAAFSWANSLNHNVSVLLFLYRENVHNMSVSSKRQILYGQYCQSICTPEVPW